jgi:hypothetical protein
MHSQLRKHQSLKELKMTHKPQTILIAFCTLCIASAATTLKAAESQRCPQTQKQRNHQKERTAVAHDQYKLSEHPDQFYWFVREFGG